MSTPNLKQDLDNYLARNDKPPVTTKLKESITNTRVAKWFSNGYSPVPTDDSSTSSGGGWFQKQPDQRDCCFSLSRTQRIIAFIICVALGLLFFSLSALYTPVLLLKARKFSLLFTLGSIFMMFSFAFLWGPMAHLKHLFSKERLLFTSSYFGTLIGTLYFAMAVQSTPLTVVFAFLQIIALLWFLFSYIPGGHTGLKFFTQLCASSVRNSVSRTLPV